MWIVDAPLSLTFLTAYQIQFFVFIISTWEQYRRMAKWMAFLYRQIFDSAKWGAWILSFLTGTRMFFSFACSVSMLHRGNTCSTTKKQNGHCWVKCFSFLCGSSERESKYVDCIKSKEQIPVSISVKSWKNF